MVKRNGLLYGPCIVTPHVKRHLGQLWWTALVILLLATPAFSASVETNSIAWDVKTDIVDAQIDGWNLERVLKSISKSTGWIVFVDPGATQTTSTQFKQLRVSDALPRLLGKLNYALIPQEKGASQLYVFRNSRSQATRQIITTDSESGSKKIPADAKPNELILQVKPGTDIEALARKLGAKVIGKIDGLNAYRLLFPDAASAASALESLQSNPDVASVDYNYIVPRPTQPEVLGQQISTPFNLKPTYNPDGSRIIIGLIDTAVQSLGENKDGFVLKPISLAGDASTDGSSPTHGTSMMDTLLQMLAAGANASQSTGLPVVIQPIDIYGSAQYTTTFDIARALDAAAAAGANPINLSLGGQGSSSILESMINQLTSQGVTIFAAAGNEHVTTPTYPAAYSSVVAVTSVTRTGDVSSYANYGDFVDVGAPGTSMVNYGGTVYAVTGTSTATAYATGAFAARVAITGVSFQQMETQIRQAWALSARTNSTQ